MGKFHGYVKKNTLTEQFQNSIYIYISQRETQLPPLKHIYLYMIHDYSISWICTDTSIQSRGDNIILQNQTTPLSEKYSISEFVTISVLSLPLFSLLPSSNLLHFYKRNTYLTIFVFKHNKLRNFVFYKIYVTLYNNSFFFKEIKLIAIAYKCINQFNPDEFYFRACTEPLMLAVMHMYVFIRGIYFASY